MGLFNGRQKFFTILLLASWLSGGRSRLGGRLVLLLSNHILEKGSELLILGVKINGAIVGELGIGVLAELVAREALALPALAVLRVEESGALSISPSLSPLAKVGVGSRSV